MTLTYQQRSMIMKLRRQEHSAEEIARALGCSSSAVRRCAALMGLPFEARSKKSVGPSGPLSEEHKEAIKLTQPVRARATRSEASR